MRMPRASLALPPSVAAAVRLALFLAIAVAGLASFQRF
jgi:hypothetical protein